MSTSRKDLPYRVLFIVCQSSDFNAFLTINNFKVIYLQLTFKAFCFEIYEWPLFKK